MGKSKIKNLGKKRYKNRLKNILIKLLIFIVIIVSIVVLYNITKYVEDLYKGKNISENTISFYMDIADEIGNKNVQISWKELLVVDMVKNDKDLSSIKKKDVINLGKRFIVTDKNEDGNKIYKLKTFNKVLDEIGFNKMDKNKANIYLKELENVYLNNIDIERQKEKIEFMKIISNKSKDNYYKYGILPSITTAQAILESGWGESYLAKESNNIFGIKADKSWDGKTIELSTTEEYNKKIVSAFRVYSSLEESIKDQGEFLKQNKRYRLNGLFDAKHYITQAQALEDAGYSTKRNEAGELIYADLLINLIRSYNLQLLDREVQTLE